MRRALPQRISVVWFKATDLRTHDHAALHAAHHHANENSPPVLHLFIFDPFWFGKTRIGGFPKTGPHRARFLVESVRDLSRRLAAAGQRLTVRVGDTARVFRELCAERDVGAVHALREVCSEERRIERRVREELAARGAELRLHWGFELYNIDDLPFDPTRHLPGSYTGFRNKVEACVVRPLLPTALGATPAEPWGATRVPDLSDLGVTDPERDPRAEAGVWEGGETAALARVEEYLWRSDALRRQYVGATMTMDPAKSCMRDGAMTKLSPWLAHGCLSPRHVHSEVRRYERERGGSKSTGWLIHELIWRDFIRCYAMRHRDAIFKLPGPAGVRAPWAWSRDGARFGLWRDGQTGVPFVDCFMRELRATGYMCHMGRETAGWFLIRDLGIDWRLGAEWFESTLIDYEPSANWGNWAYRCLPAAAAGGLPPMKRLQTVEVLKWAAQHDPDAAFIKRWVPELAPLPPTVAREPWRVSMMPQRPQGFTYGVNYPTPPMEPVALRDAESVAADAAAAQQARRAGGGKGRGAGKGYGGGGHGGDPRRREDSGGGGKGGKKARNRLQR